MVVKKNPRTGTRVGSGAGASAMDPKLYPEHKDYGSEVRGNQAMVPLGSDETIARLFTISGEVWKSKPG